MGGRLTALDHLEDADLPAARLESLLLDPSARVREVAQYRYRRCGLDPAGVYRSHLSSEFPTPSSRILIASLAGVASLGDRTDVTLIRPRLRDNRAGVRAAATAALVALAPRAEVLDVLPVLLGDPSPRVSSAAARALAAAGAPAAAAGDAWRSPQPVVTACRLAADPLTSRLAAGRSRPSGCRRRRPRAVRSRRRRGAELARAQCGHHLVAPRPRAGDHAGSAAPDQHHAPRAAQNRRLPRRTPATRRPSPPTTAVTQAAQPDLADRIRKAWWHRKPPAE